MKVVHLFLLSLCFLSLIILCPYISASNDQHVLMECDIFNDLSYLSEVEKFNSRDSFIYTLDFYKKLTNPKLKICEKLEYFYKLKESDTSDSKNKRQFMIDWLCLSLEFVSKTDKYVCPDLMFLVTNLLMLF